MNTLKIKDKDKDNNRDNDKDKIKIAVLYGGKSAEHEISLISAASIVSAINHKKFEVSLIGINQSGQWFVFPSLPQKKGEKFQAEDLKRLFHEGIPLNLSLNSGLLFFDQNGTQRIHLDFDVLFPVLHGPMGEDGSVQGLFQMLGWSYVGSGVLGSAVGMDKDVMKRLLKEADLPIFPWITITQENLNNGIDLKQVLKDLGPCVFVKPANMGSSIGVHKVESEEQLGTAIKDALRYDHKVLIEKGKKVREIEVAVLDGNPPQASLAGEIIPHKDFYSYEAKYLDKNGAELLIPAPLSKEKLAEVQSLALKTFKTLEAKGLARVDFFMTDDNHFYVNEINTLPGFTSISMFPSLWQASGLSYEFLIEKLIENAFEKGKKDRSLCTHY